MNTIDYTPNFSDKRVISRLSKAYGFIMGVTSVDKAIELSQTAIDNHMGHHGNPLSAWLRNTLLVCVDDFYLNGQFGSQCKKYMRNEEGRLFIKKILIQHGYFKGKKWDKKTEEQKLEQIVITSVVPEHILSQLDDNEERFDFIQVYTAFINEYEEELNNGKFSYMEKASRNFHPLQNMKTKWRKLFFAGFGYKFNYDGECMAPTLLLQNAIKNGLDVYLPYEMPAYYALVTNRNEFRAKVAEEASIDVRLAKVIINALIAGAVLAAGTQRALWNLIGEDYSVMRRLQLSPSLTQLRKDISLMWKFNECEMTRKVKHMADGKTRKLPYSSRQKWNLYFKLESTVMHHAYQFIEEKTGCRVFNEHDGFRTDVEIEVNELQMYVMEKTGFNVKFSQ